jgi:hypothetical protein
MPMNLTALKGTVQGYFDRAFVEVAQTDYETPLANSELGYQAKLAPNTGTFVQFRVIGELPLDTQANSDSPKTYTDEQEPSAAMTLSDEVFQASIEEIAGYVSLRARLIEQDPIDILPTVRVGGRPVPCRATVTYGGLNGWKTRPLSGLISVQARRLALRCIANK